MWIQTDCWQLIPPLAHSAEPHPAIPRPISTGSALLSEEKSEAKHSNKKSFHENAYWYRSLLRDLCVKSLLAFFSNRPKLGLNIFFFHFFVSLRISSYTTSSIKKSLTLFIFMKTHFALKEKRVRWQLRQQCKGAQITELFLYSICTWCGSRW